MHSDNCFPLYSASPLKVTKAIVWICHIYPVEVVCDGFAGRSVVRFLTDIDIRLLPQPREYVLTICKLHGYVTLDGVWFLRFSILK